MCNEVEDRVTHFWVVKLATKYPRRKFEVCYCHSNSLSSMYLSENKSIFFVDSPTITLNGTFVVMSELWSFLCHTQHVNFTTQAKPFKVCSLNKQLTLCVWGGGISTLTSCTRVNCRNIRLTWLNSICPLLTRGGVVRVSQWKRLKQSKWIRICFFPLFTV